jgi:HPr kinase/phosphorylase
LRTIHVDDLLRSKKDALELELINDGVGLRRVIESPTISNPGLVLAGYRQRFPRGRIQVLGQTEIGFLESLEPEQQRRIIDDFLALDMPAIVVTKAQEIPPALRELADRHRVPLLRSRLKTGDFYRRLQPYLEEQFAPSTTLHGSLADVYGVGLLFTGRSGIGKSECVLDLVERGHRLVADDAVIITRRGNDILLGRGHELQRHHMEIRGIGIIDIRALFGIRAIRLQKRIEVIVQLVDWSNQASYDRTGLDTEQVEILGVQIPKVTVPLNAGKNITVLSEVVAMNHLLKYAGVHSAQQFNARLQAAMRPARAYLEEDYE